MTVKDQKYCWLILAGTCSMLSILFIISGSVLKLPNSAYVLKVVTVPTCIQHCQTSSCHVSICDAKEEEISKTILQQHVLNDQEHAIFRVHVLREREHAELSSRRLNKVPSFSQQLIMLGITIGSYYFFNDFFFSLVIPNFSLHILSYVFNMYLRNA